MCRIYMWNGRQEMLPWDGHLCPGAACAQQPAHEAIVPWGCWEPGGASETCALPKLAVGRAEKRQRLLAVETAAKQPEQWHSCSCCWAFSAWSWTTLVPIPSFPPAQTRYQLCSMPLLPFFSLAWSSFHFFQWPILLSFFPFSSSVSTQPPPKWTQMVTALSLHVCSSPRLPFVCSPSPDSQLSWQVPSDALYLCSACTITLPSWLLRWSMLINKKTKGVLLSEFLLI